MVGITRSRVIIYMYINTMTDNCIYLLILIQLDFFFCRELIDAGMF